MTPVEDDTPLDDPAESLALIQREQSNLARDLTPDWRLLYWPWGIAWLISFGAFFLRFGPDGRVFVDMPDWLPLVLLAVLMTGAGIVTGIAGSRNARTISGPSNRQGAFYGITWSAGFLSMSVLFSQFGDLLPQAQLSLLWGAGLVALTGVMHMAGGAVWNDRALFFLGAWTNLINVVGILIGPGWHSLIVAIGGGGAMLLAGLIGRSR
jgi:hypothetical protein